MPVTDQQVATLRAYLAGDPDEYHRLRARLKETVDQTGYAALIAAAFFVAVERRFSANCDIADVVSYVGDARARFDQDGRMVDPRAAERMVLAVSADEEIDDIDDRTRGQIQIVLLLALIVDEQLDDAGLDEFLSGSRRLADDLVS